MKLTDSIVNNERAERPRGLSVARSGAHAASAGAKSAKDAPSGDVVSLDRQKRLLQLALEGADPAGRTARLEQLSDVVAAGRYEVDAEAVSKALVEEALERG
jgi:flagellar biosynthesis anti-sigma factor FlgM